MKHLINAAAKMLFEKTLGSEENDFYDIEVDQKTGNIISVVPKESNTNPEAKKIAAEILKGLAKQKTQREDIQEQVRVKAKTKTVQRIMDQYIGISDAEVIEDLLSTLAKYQEETAKEIADQSGKEFATAFFKSAQALKLAAKELSKRQGN
jgi:hypothetical protein